MGTVRKGLHNKGLYIYNFYGASGDLCACGAKWAHFDPPGSSMAQKMVWLNKNTPTQRFDMDVALLQGLLGRRSTVEIWTLEREVAL